jgi:hypothetical protein
MDALKEKKAGLIATRSKFPAPSYAEGQNREDSTYEGHDVRKSYSVNIG